MLFAIGISYILLLVILLETHCLLLALYIAFLFFIHLGKVCISSYFSQENEIFFPIFIWMEFVPPDLHDCFVSNLIATKKRCKTIFLLKKKKKMKSQSSWTRYHKLKFYHIYIYIYKRSNTVYI